MATTMTLLELRNAVRHRADMVNSAFITDAELTGYLNQSLFELYDILIQHYSDDYFVASAEATASGNFFHINLPADFYKLSAVDLEIATDEWETLRPFTLAERNSGIGDPLRYRIQGSNLWFTPKPAAGQKFRIWYVPRLEPLVNDSDISDGISGWLEFVIVDSAIKCLQKEESDASSFMAQKQALLQRIESAAQSRDAGGLIRAAPTAFDGFYE